MSKLSSLIILGNYEEVRGLILQRPELANEADQNPAFERKVYPLDWALKSENYQIYTLLLRMGAKSEFKGPANNSLLGNYVAEVSQGYFAAQWMEGIEQSVWQQLFEGRGIFFDGQEPQYGLTGSEKEDLTYLLELCAIENYVDFLGILNDY